jgi:hypothetical protein
MVCRLGVSPTAESSDLSLWDWSRTSGSARHLFAGKDVASEPEVRCCIMCGTPLPSTARADARLCSAAYRQRAKRRGMASAAPPNNPDASE